MLEGKGNHDENGIDGGVDYIPTGDQLSENIPETPVPTEDNEHLTNSGVDILTTPPIDKGEVEEDRFL
jgi:hypothetical protein